MLLCIYVEQRTKCMLQQKQSRITVCGAAKLRSEAFDRQDLLEIRAIADERLDELERQQRLEMEQLQAVAAKSRRLASGRIEAKMVTNGKSARQFGPYLYARFMEDGHYRSRYIGKAP
jgi:hypothetical protein